MIEAQAWKNLVMSQPSIILPDSQTVIEEVNLPDSGLWSDEPPLESDKHREQIDALIRLIKWWWRNRDDFYAAGNLTIYLGIMPNLAVYLSATGKSKLTS